MLVIVVPVILSSVLHLSILKIFEEHSVDKFQLLQVSRLVPSLWLLMGYFEISQKNFNHFYLVWTSTTIFDLSNR